MGSRVSKEVLQSESNAAPAEERPATISAALHASHEVALRAILLETAPADLFAWRSEIGTNLMQEAARRGYRHVVEHLLQNGTAAQLQEEADAQGNYSTHLAAKDGNFHTYIVLAKSLPRELHLQPNNEGAFTLSLAMESLVAPCYSSCRYVMEQMLPLFPSDMMACALARCPEQGKSPWQRLLKAMDLQWLHVILGHIRERKEWKDILCATDRKGRNVAHYVVRHNLREWCFEEMSREVRPGLRPPTFEEVLDCIPTEAFAMEDKRGKRPWQYFASRSALDLDSAHRLERILSHTTTEGLFSAEKTSEERIHISRGVLSVVISAKRRADFCDTLRAILSRLPPGTADGCLGGDEPPLLKLLRSCPIWTGPTVVMEFLTEEGFLAVTSDGESFAHLAVRGVHRLRENREKGCETFLRILRTKACEQVDCFLLLSMRCRQGLTAADLAEQLGIPQLADELRPTTAKAAAA